jgi:Arc/MetJ-type ribon-helix-helix transcriptional regulator
MPQKTALNFRISEAILRRIDKFVESGEYSDRTEFVLQAVYYQLNKEELRRDFKDEIIKDAETMMRKVMYDTKMMENIQRMVKATVISIKEEMEKNGKRICAKNQKVN